MKKNLLKILLINLILLSAVNLFSSDNIKIIISKGSGHPSYQNYINWINDSYPDIEVIDVYQKNRIFNKKYRPLSN